MMGSGGTHPGESSRETHAMPKPGLAGKLARAEAVLILAVAVVLGGVIRFTHLGVAEITGDEAASWATASAPTLAGVIRANHRRNPGTLALHDLILHWWIQMFGHSEAALRSLSATLGTAVIALVFFVSYELLVLPVARGDGGATDTPTAEVTAALSALTTALSLVMINSSREARMYPLTLAFELAQIGFFLRGTRRGAWPDFAAIAFFTALATAANFTSVFAFAAEGAWFAWRLIAERRRGGGRDACGWRSALSVLAGFALLAPFASVVAAQLRSGLERKWSWIAPPRLIDPLETFESASGVWVFVVLAALALWAVLSCWRSRRDQIAFATIWMWVPVLLQLSISYLFRPMDEIRYVLSSFVGFYILAALGIVALGGGARMRGAAAALLALTMVTHVYRYDEQTSD